MPEKKLSDQQFFFKGADSDTNPELIQIEQGRYRDARNFRPISIDGNTGALQKIRGEASVYNYSNVYVTPLAAYVSLTDYVCVGSCSCNGYEVAFWANDNTGYSAITINELIACYSEDLPLSEDHPLQIDVNENCTGQDETNKGGELFITDYNVSPMIFDIKSILDAYNSNETTYFTDFNINIYTTSLQRQLDIPVFDSYVSSGAGGGLEAGYYSYAMRYVDASGNYTQWSMSTPLIPVIERFEAGSLQYPHTTTYGASATYITSNGIRLKFRVNNANNYSYIQIKRLAYNSGAQLGVPATPEYTDYATPLIAGEISVHNNFIDKHDTEWLPLSDEETFQTFNIIEKAKAIRYYNNRLVLMNIKYPSKDIENVITFLESPSGNMAYPYIHKLGKDGDDSDGTVGFKDPFNTAYYKQYMHGEKYGFAALCFDSNGDRTFAVPLTIDTAGTDFTNYQFPNRRDVLAGDSYKVSVSQGKGAIVACDTSNTNNQYTHEVAALKVNSAYKSSSSAVICIGTAGGHTYNTLNPRYQTNVSGAVDSTTDHAYQINDYVCLDGGTPTTDYAYYNPKGFAPEYYAMGLAVHGISDIPAWVSAISIVRTKPAGRVVCQGLATYAYNFSGTPGTRSTKGTRTIWFWSDDVSFLGLSLSANYKIQFVSPVGYFTEVYNSNYGGFYVDGSLGYAFKEIEMVSYARVIRNSQVINPNLYRSDGVIEYETMFGRWRNADPGAGNPFGATVDGNKIFDVDNISIENLASGRGSYYEIALNAANPVYVHGDPAINTDVNNIDSQNWAEPVYIVNIINDDADVPDNNINNYIETGHYQKIISDIGIYSGSVGSSFQLVDERYEDVSPSPYDSSFATLNCFLYIVDPNTLVERPWLNVQYKSNADVTTILNALAATGYYDAAIPGGVKRIYGVYYFDYDERGHSIIFSQPIAFAAYNVSFFIPPSESILRVRYDSRFPMKVFGGDTTINESIACFLDYEYDKDGNPEGDARYANILRPHPYWGHRYNPNYRRVLNAADTFNAYQWNGSGTNWGDAVNGYNYTLMQYIRQHIWMYTAESRCHLGYLHDIASVSTGVCNQSTTLDSYLKQEFPNIHYIPRPEKWAAIDSNCNGNFAGSGGVISTVYQSDYPNETNIWKYGGFRFGNQSYIDEMGNTDYTQWNSNSQASSKPAVGYVEKYNFCTRIVYSSERSINEQNDPNLRSYPSDNAFDISDHNGAIKYAYDTETSKGNNLYAITNGGVCLLITGKTTLSDMNANTLGYMNPDTNFIQNQYWLSNDIGMNDEMWRSAAEYKKALLWANSQSVYMMIDNTISDIGRESKYFNVLYNEGLSQIGTGYTTGVCACVDRKYEEYWFTIKTNGVEYSKASGDITLYDSLGTGDVLVENGSYVILTGFHPLAKLILDFSNDIEIYIYNSTNNAILVFDDTGNIIDILPYAAATEPYAIAGYASGAYAWERESSLDDYLLRDTYVYNIRNQSWNGRYDIRADKFIVDKNSTYIIKDEVVYGTDTGHTLNGSTLTAYVIAVSAIQQPYGKEFIDIRIASDQKPTRVDFAEDEDSIPECSLYAGMSTPVNAYYLKDYNGWQNYIPRKTSGDRNRVQGRSMFYKITYSSATEFNLTDVVVGSKVLKIN